MTFPLPTQSDADTQRAVVAIAPVRLGSPEAALYLGLRPKTLTNWRSAGKGPRFHRAGEKRSRVYYLVSDLDAWVAECTHSQAA